MKKFVMIAAAVLGLSSASQAYSIPGAGHVNFNGRGGGSLSCKGASGTCAETFGNYIRIYADNCDCWGYFKETNDPSPQPGTVMIEVDNIEPVGE